MQVSFYTCLESYLKSKSLVVFLFFCIYQLGVCPEDVYDDRHLFPSAKLTFSSQWLLQDISLFLHEISPSLEISVHKSLSLFNF